ncbi:putative purine permease [[Candida] jaroonii]|uniref:Purine permease n=1 Tax=[Candida] jaroonii TaxID=467808 RepID=A0ACA9Y019_9ASCO|nr:putative purine permease [[Candida] jaroonii]
MVNVNVQGTLKRWGKKWTTREGLLGDYDYGYLFIPQLPFTKKTPKTQPFFGLNDKMPVILGLLLGFQHALAMLAGVVTPPIMISAAANLDADTQNYLVSTSLIVTGILSSVQITRFHIYGTKYHIGTGLLSVVGTSFATINIVSQGFPLMYENGVCEIIDGVKQPCPDGYGKILGTAMVCCLIEVLLSFTPAKILQKVFPSIITGSVVLLIGAHLVHSGANDWLGGSYCAHGTCASNHGTTAPWGSAQFIGLGFTVFVSIVFFERFGSPIMKSCAVILGLLMGCIVGAATGYFTPTQIENAKAVSFVWVKTFKLGFYAPVVLPFIMVYVVLMMEAIGDITATADLSKVDLESEEFESRVQGGVLADGLFGVFAGLMTMTPYSTFAQNNGVISITKCASRRVGYYNSAILIIMGVFAKLSGVILSIHKSVLGGMTSFLFASVAASGMKIISESDLSRRNRFILTCIFVIGLPPILMESWFSNVFTYDGDNTGLKSFFQALTLVANSGFAIGGFVGLIVNLILPMIEDEVEEIDEVIVTNQINSSSSAEQQYVHKEMEKGMSSE